MLTAELSQRDLVSLRAPREFPAVSAIMPARDPALLANLLDEAGTRLSGANLPDGMAAEVISSLAAAAAEAEHGGGAEALVLFAAPGGEHHAFGLPYVRPRARVAIGQSFATRDLVAAREHVGSYWVLVLSEQPARLWSGAGARLTESLDLGFPVEGRDPWHALGEMAGVLARDCRPLVVTGAPRYLAYFEQLAPASVRSQFIGSAEGGSSTASGPELASIVAPVLTAERARWQRAAIERLEIARSERLFASGLPQVWDLAADGQIRELVAEEGFLAPAREIEGRLLPPGNLGGEPVDDAIEVIMDSVLDAGGEVIFVPDGSLESCHRVAAGLRY